MNEKQQKLVLFYLQLILRRVGPTGSIKDDQHSLHFFYSFRGFFIDWKVITFRNEGAVVKPYIAMNARYKRFPNN
jgi:hypothetical protein